MRSFQSTSKPPQFPPSAIVRDLRGDGWHVQCDLSPQVLSLRIPDEQTHHEQGEPLAPTWRYRKYAFIQQDTFISASARWPTRCSNGFATDR